MLTLYLVRHAKSDWTNEHVADIDRPLDERGYEDALEMSKLLKSQNVFPDLVLSSPAIRAISTALIFSRNLKYNTNKIKIQEKLYNTDVHHYLSVIINNSGEATSIMLFGHNPVITSLTNRLSKVFTDEMPTCAITGIKFKTKLWEEITEKPAELFLFDFPKNHPR